MQRLFTMALALNIFTFTLAGNAFAMSATNVCSARPNVPAPAEGSHCEYAKGDGTIGMGYCRSGVCQ